MIRQGGNHLVLKVVTVTRNLDPDDTARKKGARPAPLTPAPAPPRAPHEPCPWERGQGGLGCLSWVPRSSHWDPGPREQEKSGKGGRADRSLPSCSGGLRQGLCSADGGRGRSPDRTVRRSPRWVLPALSLCRKRGAVHRSQRPQSLPGPL